MPTAKRRVQVIIPDAVRLLGFDPSSVSATQLANSLERYAGHVARASRRLDRMLTRAEWHLIADALNGCLELWDNTGEIGVSQLTAIRANVEDAIHLDGLDAKWSVDGPALVRKLGKLTEIEGDAIAAAVRYFWAEGEGEGQEVNPEAEWWTIAYRQGGDERGRTQTR